MFNMAKLLFRTFKDVSLRVMGLTLERVKLQERGVSTMLEEMDDDEDLQLHTTSDFKVDHVDAYDSDCDDEATIHHDAAQYVPHPERNKDAMILSVIEQMKGQVDLCNTVNQEAKSINKSFSNELE
ncbi:hypothetical protein Tco_1490328 [Tanacetum coccineum]